MGPAGLRITSAVVLLGFAAMFEARAQMSVPVDIPLSFASNGAPLQLAINVSVIRVWLI